MKKLSETPRTDAAYHSADYEYVVTEDEAWAFARKLERELNELTRDKERLDWLEKSDYELYDSSTDSLFSESSREAIDEAIQQTINQ